MNIPAVGARFLFPCFLFLTVLTAWGPVTDHDFGFNVAAGRIIISEKTIPDVDHLSIAGEGRPWVNRLWGFQVVLYGFHEYLGLAGVSFFVSLLAVATFLLLILASGRRDQPCTPYVFLIALFIVQFRLRARPEVVSFFFLAVVYYLLDLFQRDEKAGFRTIFLVPLVQILWVNCHGLYILGIALQILLLASWLLEKPLSPYFHVRDSFPSARKKKVLAFIFFLSCAASFLNPFGWEGVFVPFAQFKMMGANNFFSNITELVPMHLLLAGLWENDKMFLAALAIFLGMGLLAYAKPRNGIPLYHFFVFVAFLYLALKSNRNIAVFVLVTAPAIPALLAGKNIFDQGISPDPRKALVLLTALIVLRLAVPASTFLFNYPLRSGLYPEETFALRPARFMIENNIPGPVFPTDLRDGNLLLWKEIRPVYDGRLEVFGEEFFRRYHQETILTEKKFMEVVDQYGSRAVLVRHYIDNRYPTIPRFIPLRAYDLYRNPEWALVYFDSSFALFVLRDSVDPDLVERFRYDFSTDSAVERIMAPSAFYHPEEEDKYLEETGRLAAMLTIFQAPDAVRKVISIALKDRR